MSEYKKIQCIEKMDEDYLDRFNSIVDEYAPKLSERVIMNGSAFTLHDFEHHCFDIYKIISEVLFDEELIYKADYGISQRELFILNLAVLFHDIGMFNVLGATRENHSIKSAYFVQKEYDDSRSVFKKKSDLTVNELKALKAIIIAHSDVKDRTVEDKENGMKSPDLKDYNAKEGKIRAKFLAGVLRLADELDVSSDRLGSGEIEQQIEEGIKQYEELKKHDELEANRKELEKWQGFMVSLEHWKRLHLISSVQRNEDGKTIELQVDDDYIDICLDEGKTEKSIARECIDIYNEIEKKLNEVIDSSFNQKKFSNYVPVSKIILVTTNEILDKEISDGLSIRRLVSQKDNVTSNTAKSGTKSRKYPMVLDETLEKDIYEEITKRNLIKFGHFLLNKTYCARDWIDTKEIVETKRILNKLVDIIVKDINSNTHNDYAIIGIDLVGSLLASRVAFALQRPLSYIVSEKEELNNASSEIELSIKKTDDIILITDVIVTYDTILKAVDKYSFKMRMDSIYTIFYRPNYRISANNDLVSKTYSINNMFSIELFEKKDCVYKKNNCIAQNKKINEGENDNENN